MIKLFAFLNLFTAIPAAIACLPLERRRQARMPGTKPYRWGIFIGLNGLLVGAVLLAAGIVETFSSDPWPLKNRSAFWATVGGITSVAAGYAAVRRRRVGLIVAILLSLNVLWWFVGLIYVWKRWAELRATFDRAAEPARARADPSAGSEPRVEQVAPYWHWWRGLPRSRTADEPNPLHLMGPATTSTGPRRVFRAAKVGLAALAFAVGCQSVMVILLTAAAPAAVAWLSGSVWLVAGFFLLGLPIMVRWLK